MLDKFKKIKINIGLKSLILIGVCIALILVDILTKIFEERDGWYFTVIPNFIEVSSGSRNPGCAFSFLANASWGQTFLIVTTFILLVALIGLFIVLPERFTILKIALTLIVAGAIGNLIDRISFREVRDFVGINMFGKMVSCNFADFWIVFGSILAAIDILFLNEWSVFPLTKSAREAQKKREEEKETTKAGDTAQEEAKDSEIKEDGQE